MFATLLNKKSRTDKIIVSLFFIGLILFAVSNEFIFLLPSFAALFLTILLRNFKLAYWILLFFIPLSIHAEFAENTFSLALPTEPIMLLFYVLAIMIVIVQHQSIPEWFLKNAITIVILLQFVWLIVAVIFSEVPALSLKYLLSKSWYLVCFFLIPIWIFNAKKDFKTAFIVIAAPLIIYIGIILFRHSLYGFTFYNIDAAVGNLFYKHVDYASVISMFFPFVLAAFLIVKKTHKKWGRILLFLVLVFIAAIILSYTRAAMGAVIFGLIVVFAIRLKMVNFIIPGFYAFALALLVYFTTDNRFLKYHPHFQDTYMHHEFADHLQATLQGKDMSSVERLYRWIAAGRMAVDKPITGFGPHSFYYFYKPYTLSTYRTYVSENYERSTTHNYFLLMQVEQGLPATLLYAFLVILVLAKAQKIYHRFKDSFYKILTLAIVMSFSVFFINNLFSEILETDKVGPMVYLLLSFLVLLDYKSKRATEAALLQKDSIII